MLKSQNPKHLPNENPRHVRFLLGSKKTYPKLLWETERKIQIHVNWQWSFSCLQWLPEKISFMKNRSLAKRKFLLPVLGFIWGVWGVFFSPHQAVSYGSSANISTANSLWSLPLHGAEQARQDWNCGDSGTATNAREEKGHEQYFVKCTYTETGVSIM